MTDVQEQELEWRLEEARRRVEDADQRPLAVSVDELNGLRAAAHQAWSDLEEYRRKKRQSAEPAP